MGMESRIYRAIVEGTEGQDGQGHATGISYAVKGDDALRGKAVIPWHLRGKAGDLKKGVEVLVEVCTDRSGLVVARADGWSGGTYVGGSEDSLIRLGEGASDFVALAKEVHDALTDIKTYIDAHTHDFVGQGTVQKPPTGIWTSGVPDVSAKKVKAE